MERIADDDQDEMTGEPFGNERVPSVSSLEFEDVERFNDHFSIRAVVVGVLVGGLMCFSNMYFGLQTGWVTMGSLQSTLLGFGIFKVLQSRLSTHFSPMENVILQTTAVATATMPLAGGFVGILPALKMLDPAEDGSNPVVLNWWQLILWSIAICFFGVFFAVPLRKQTILKEKLKFPSGTATAQMIKVLHKMPNDEYNEDEDKINEDDEFLLKEKSQTEEESKKEWRAKWTVLFWSFAVSALYTFLGYFFPALKNLPVFSWLGLHTLTEWNWMLTPSLSYVGQGMIMGIHTGWSMLLGAVVGWGIIGPIAKACHWAPGPVNSWKTGAKGWILWISLSIMMAEAMVGLIVLVVKSVISYRKNVGEKVYDPAPASQQVPRNWWIGGLIVSSLLCVVVVSPLFNMPIYEPIAAVILALLVSVLAVRALGETDLNPVSGVGKVSQIVFAAIAPGNVVANIVAGAIAEAGAQQAGDLMQDLKTGHLLRASPRAQFYGQMIGSFFSVFFAVIAYQLYSSAYPIPGPDFPVPTAGIWLDMARLLNGGVLASHVQPFCICFALLGGALPVIHFFFPISHKYLPSGIAFAIAMYVTPNWTIPRVVGAFIQYYWQKKRPEAYNKYMIIVASGFVLGEGVTSILNAIMKSADLGILSCVGCAPGVCSGC